VRERYTHWRQGIRKLLKGSTAEESAYSATVPVLMVGPKVTRRFDFKQILYACDISDSVMYVLPYALSLLIPAWTHTKMGTGGYLKVRALLTGWNEISM
jgi:hypothetical protein